MEISRGNGRKIRLYEKQLAALFFQKSIASFSYQRDVSTNRTHGSRHYCFREQSNLHQLCGLWYFSNQIWTFFLFQQRPQLPGWKIQSFHERCLKFQIVLKAFKFKRMKAFAIFKNELWCLVVACFDKLAKQKRCKFV